MGRTSVGRQQDTQDGTKHKRHHHKRHHRHHHHKKHEDDKNPTGNRSEADKPDDWLNDDRAVFLTTRGTMDTSASGSFDQSVVLEVAERVKHTTLSPYRRRYTDSEGINDTHDEEEGAIMHHSHKHRHRHHRKREDDKDTTRVKSKADKSDELLEEQMSMSTTTRGTMDTSVSESLDHPVVLEVAERVKHTTLSPYRRRYTGAEAIGDALDEEKGVVVYDSHMLKHCHHRKREDDKDTTRVKSKADKSDELLEEQTSMSTTRGTMNTSRSESIGNPAVLDVTRSMEPTSLSPYSRRRTGKQASNDAHDEEEGAVMHHSHKHRHRHHSKLEQDKNTIGVKSNAYKPNKLFDEEMGMSVTSCDTAGTSRSESIDRPAVLDATESVKSTSLSPYRRRHTGPELIGDTDEEVGAIIHHSHKHRHRHPKKSEDSKNTTGVESRSYVTEELLREQMIMPPPTHGTMDTATSERVVEHVAMNVVHRVRPTSLSPYHARYPGAEAIGDANDEEEGTVLYRTGSIDDIAIPEITTAHRVDSDIEDELISENRRLRQIVDHAPVAPVVTFEPDPVRSDESSSVNKRRRWGVLGIILLTVAGALGAVLGVTLSSNDDESPSPETNLINLLSSVSSDGGGNLGVPGRPQNKAVKWLSGNANLGDYSDEKIIQRYALATLYYSTIGDNWFSSVNWMDDGEECGRWRVDNGVDNLPLKCDESGFITSLNLWSNNLARTIPPEIGLLSRSLEQMNLGSNDITGLIPTEIGMLTNLRDWRFDTTKLSGSIPSEIRSLRKVGRLWLYNTHLFGTIPSEIALMTDLSDLRLYSNKLEGDQELTGTIPSEIGLLTQMRWLTVWGNKLSGTIPSSINRLTNLELLRLYDNNLTGNFICPEYIETCLVSCANLDNDACRILSDNSTVRK